MTPPEVAVLATGVGSAGGVEKATEEFVIAAARESSVSLAVVRRGTNWPQGARTIYAGGEFGERVPLSVQASVGFHCLAWAARQRGAGASIVATHVSVAPLAQLMAKLTGGSFVLWCHGIEVWGSLGFLRRAAVRRADLLLAGSDFTMQRLIERGMARGAGELLRYPTPPIKVSNAERMAPRVVVCVARLNRRHAYKGVDTLIRAWPSVVRNHPDAQLLIVGDGDDRPRLERMTRRLHVDDTAQFLGRVSDDELGKAYRQASVFALPGRARLGARPEGEGFGLVFLEAASAGLPTVAGRGGGAEEAVVDGVTGLLVDPSSPTDVARAISSLLSDPARAREMGEAGRARASSDFSVGRFQDDVAKVLLKLRRS